MSSVFVSAWVGAGNLGDELLFRRLLDLLRVGGADEVTVVSLDPVATESLHGVTAVHPRALHRVVTALRRADLVIVGPGGLLQDASSPFNLPYQLHRAILARALDVPVLGLGLGADPMHRRGSGTLLRLGLGSASTIAVRDEPSRRALAAHGVVATTTADLAVATMTVEAAEDPSSTLVVSLRPWRNGGRVPVRWQRHALHEAQIAATATAIDQIVADTDLAVRFVAFEPHTDHPLHEAIAARLATPSTCLVPSLDELVAVVADSAAVVATRYHAAVVGLIAQRPVTAIGYAPKVQAIAAELEGTVSLVADDAGGLASLPTAVTAAMGVDANVRQTDVAGLRRREAETAALVAQALAG